MSNIDLTVTIYASSYQKVTIRPGGRSAELYDKWLESQADADFEELADWIKEDVRDNLDFDIEDLEE